jgi:hypothetical protein
MGQLGVQSKHKVKSLPESATLFYGLALTGMRRFTTSYLQVLLRFDAGLKPA